MWWLHGGEWPDMLMGAATPSGGRGLGDTNVLMCALRLRAFRPERWANWSSIGNGADEPNCFATTGQWRRFDPTVERLALSELMGLLSIAKERLDSGKAAAQNVSKHMAEISPLDDNSHSRTEERLRAAMLLHTLVSKLHGRLVSGVQTALRELDGHEHRESECSKFD